MTAEFLTHEYRVYAGFNFSLNYPNENVLHFYETWNNNSLRFLPATDITPIFLRQ